MGILSGLLTIDPTFKNVYALPKLMHVTAVLEMMQSNK